MSTKIRYIIIAMLLFYSCNSNRQKYDFSSNEINISGTKVDIGVMLAAPIELIYLDPLLLFFDFYKNTFVTVFDTKNGQFVRRFITEGQGPGEVTYSKLSLFVSTADKQMYLYQNSTRRINIYEQSDIIDKESIIPKQLSFENANYIKKVKDGYIGVGYFEDGRFRLYDSAGNIISSFGEYPFRGKETAMNYMDRFILYQGVLASSADGNYFAIGTNYCDNLEFYHIENGKAELIKKYETYDAKAIMNGNFIQVDNDCIMNYLLAYGGKYCYMLYSGEHYRENNKLHSIGGSKIIVFDWNGNYIKSYKTDMFLRAFCVDEENNIIYASASDYNDETGGGAGIFKVDMK